MNDQRDFDRAVDRWLDDGSDATPRAVIDAVLLAARSTPQERDFRIPWRSSPMKPFAYAVAAVAAVAVSIAALAALSLRFGIGSELTPTEQPSVDLGIFEPAAGRIVYYTNSGLWAVDPSAPTKLVRLRPEGTGDAGQFASFTVPLGWSSDGTELLFEREDPTDQTFPYERHLYILHADGTETQVTPEPVGGAAVSPDGSRVVFASSRDDGLYVVDAEGGQPVRIADGEEPTFSPDGTQIAYLSKPRSGCCVKGGREHVWVANVDGTDAHEILADEPALATGVWGLTWSPAGDRIAMGNGAEGQIAIYTFAPDGSHFTKVITGGINPHWSPAGSQIAYGLPGRDGLWIADADGSDVRSSEFGAPGPWHPGE
jgi:dipeptidyl aminopeptidase/acylaminoacyl peptidase